MSSFTVALICFALVALCSAAAPQANAPQANEQFTLPGNCPNYAPQQNMNAQKASGQWYGVANAWNGVNKPQNSCLKSNHQMAQDGSVSSTIEYKNPQNQKITKNLNGIPVQSGKVGQYVYRRDNDASHDKTNTVLKTDNDNYMVIVSCQQNNGKHAYNAIVLSRQQTLSEAHMNEAKAAFQAANVNNQLQPISQNNCS